MNYRALKNRLFILFSMGCTWVAAIVLMILIVTIVRDGWSALSWEFLTNYPSRRPSEAGIYAAIVGSVWIVGLTIIIAVPLGVTTALYLEEYMRKTKWRDAIEMNIATLAGMPSIVYGLLALTFFVRFFGFERSILSGALCMSLLILPTIIIASQGAIRSVPMSLREAAYAIGARKYHAVFGQVLPAALPGIMTGIILSVSRVVGESAPLILLGALSYVAYTPSGVMDSFTVLPIQIFNWIGRPQKEFHTIAAGGIIVLIVFLFCLNLAAVLIRNRFQRYK